MSNGTSQPGSILDLTAPYNVASGGGAKVGSIFGVAQNAVLSGALGQFQVNGVHQLAKATGAAWTEGLVLYWDDTAKNVTSTASTNKLIGVAVRNPVTGLQAASGDAVGFVRLNGAFIS